MVSGKNEVELKGGMYAFISLRLHTSDIDAIDQQIADKVQQAPTFFKGTPVVVDLTPLEEEFEGSADLDTGALLERIRAHDLVPIVANVSDKSSPLALSIDIPLIERGAKQSQVTSGIVPAEDKPDHQSESTQGTPAQPLPALAPEVQFVVVAPMLIDKPVRSGQQIYARDTDLVVVSSAAAGSELIADNNIHVYGPLRGRALCGVSGNTNARIFCQSLEAEIVSVAGNYRLLEEIPEDLRGKPAQIWLDGDRLNIESV